MSEKEIINYIHEQILGGEDGIELTAQEDLLTSGLVDSLGMMRLIGHIEKTTQSKIPPQDMVIENFMTVEAITAYLKKR